MNRPKLLEYGRDPCCQPKNRNEDDSEIDSRKRLKEPMTSKAFLCETQILISDEYIYRYYFYVPKGRQRNLFVCAWCDGKKNGDGWCWGRCHQLAVSILILMNGSATDGFRKTTTDGRMNDLSRLSRKFFVRSLSVARPASTLAGMLSRACSLARCTRAYPTPPARYEYRTYVRTYCTSCCTRSKSRHSTVHQCPVWYIPVHITQNKTGFGKCPMMNDEVSTMVNVDHWEYRRIQTTNHKPFHPPLSSTLPTCRSLEGQSP